MSIPDLENKGVFHTLLESKLYNHTFLKTSLQTRDMDAVLVQCWPTIDDGGPALDCRSACVSSLLACHSGPCLYNTLKKVRSSMNGTYVWAYFKNCMRFNFESRLSALLLWARALVQWLKMFAWKVGYHGFEPHSGLQVSKEQNVSSPLTCKDCVEPP